jgi:peptide chain release factor 1
MVGSGDRSEKIRTYNYKENRVTDHRIGLTIYQLHLFMEGVIDEVIDALVSHFQAEKLKAEAVAA